MFTTVYTEKHVYESTRIQSSDSFNKSTACRSQDSNHFTLQYMCESIQRKSSDSFNGPSALVENFQCMLTSDSSTRGQEETQLDTHSKTFSLSVMSHSSLEKNQRREGMTHRLRASSAVIMHLTTKTMIGLWLVTRRCNVHKALVRTFPGLARDHRVRLTLWLVLKCLQCFRATIACTLPHGLIESICKTCLWPSCTVDHQWVIQLSQTHGSPWGFCVSKTCLYQSIEVYHKDHNRPVNHTCCCSVYKARETHFQTSKSLQRTLTKLNTKATVGLSSDHKDHGESYLFFTASMSARHVP